MAAAADSTIAQVDSCVALGGLDPEHIVTPGIYVDHVVAVGERPWLVDGRFVGGTDAAGVPVSRGPSQSEEIHRPGHP